MKKKLLLSEFLDVNNNIAIECESESEASELLGILRKKGRRWNTGSEICEWMHTRYLVEGIGTCYSSEVYCMATPDCRAMGYTIYKFEEVEFVNDISDVVKRNRYEIEKMIEQLKILEEKSENELRIYRTAIIAIEQLLEG